MRYDEVKSRKMSYYSNRVLKDIQFREPPLKVESVLKYFDLKIVTVGANGMSGLLPKTEQRLPIPAALVKWEQKSVILLNDNDSIERQRLSVLHECGHHDLPWHDDHNYMNCEMYPHGSTIQVELEKEAFKYAANLLFPASTFGDDIRDTLIGISTIRSLSRRYCASFEATAIRYVKLHPGMCAVVYLQLATEKREDGCPFVVRYSIKSKRFHRLLKPGAGVKFNELISRAFESSQQVCGEIPAADFGSQKKHSYNVQLERYSFDQVCAFLWDEDSQTCML